MSNPAYDPTLPPAPPAGASPSHAATFTGGQTQAVPWVVPTAPPGYRIEKELGRGGMGVVYLAHQFGLNRAVALKMVLSGGQASPDELVRFLNEAESIAQLHHPNVVQIYEVGSHAGVPFFTLEYCSGGGLDAKLGGTPLSSGESARLIEAIARGVHAAHLRGIVHRDLKPHNVLLAADGTPKVTDFGVAKRLGTGSDLTQTGAVMGTPSYMAPEQAAGKGKLVTPAADVYSLGALLYEMLTGRPPFKAATPLDTLLLVVSAEPILPRQLNPRTPADLETIALKCLHKDPARRYASAADLADDLNRFRTRQPITARPVSAVERGWRWVRRNPLLAGVMVGGPALLAVTTVVILIALLMTAAANVELDAERQKAQNQEREAVQQRAVAHARLEKAVEAVDRMMTRVASERWATNPELQDERRRVLEDAVAFYTGLTGDDSTDPLVRKETAKAHARVAGVYLMLGDLAKAEAACAEAVRLYDGLTADSPNDPELPAAASEVWAIAGGANALNARYADAVIAYRRAVECADSARDKDAESARFKYRAVEARALLGYFYLQADRKRGEATLDPMLRLAREIGTAPDALYEHRVAFAFALCVAAAYDLNNPTLPGPGRFAAASAKYDQAAAALDGLDRRAAPTARSRERFAHTRALVAVQRGFIASATAATAEGKQQAVKQMEAGLSLFDDLLKPNPKAFPYLLQKYQLLRALAEVYKGLGDTQRAASATAAGDTLIEAMIRDNPNLDWLRSMDAQRQTTLLIEKVRRDERAGFEAEAEELAKLARSVGNPLALYNVACVYAVAAGERPVDADRHASKAVAILTELMAGGYFRPPGRVAHLDRDTDLDALRGRDDYKRFRKALDLPADPPNPR